MTLLSEHIEREEVESEELDSDLEDQLASDIAEKVDGVWQFQTNLPFSQTKLLEMLHFIRDLRDTRLDQL